MVLIQFRPFLTRSNYQIELPVAENRWPRTLPPLTLPEIVSGKRNEPNMRQGDAIDGLDIGDRGFSRPPLDTLLVSYGRDPVSQPTCNGGSLTEAGRVSAMGLPKDGTILHSVAALRLVGFPRIDRSPFVLKPGVPKAGGASNRDRVPILGMVFPELPDFQKFLRQPDRVGFF